MCKKGPKRQLDEITSSCPGQERRPETPTVRYRIRLVPRQNIPEADTAMEQPSSSGLEPTRQLPQERERGIRILGPDDPSTSRDPRAFALPISSVSSLTPTILSPSILSLPSPCLSSISKSSSVPSPTISSSISSFPTSFATSTFSASVSRNPLPSNTSTCNDAPVSSCIHTPSTNSFTRPHFSPRRSLASRITETGPLPFEERTSSALSLVPPSVLFGPAGPIGSYCRAVAPTSLLPSASLSEAQAISPISIPSLHSEGALLRTPSEVMCPTSNLPNNSLLPTTSLPTFLPSSTSLPPIQKNRYWNCHQPGHRYPDCSFPQNRRFCKGCGAAGYIRTTCPRCKNRTPPSLVVFSTPPPELPSTSSPTSSSSPLPFLPTNPSSSDLPMANRPEDPPTSPGTTAALLLQMLATYSHLPQDDPAVRTIIAALREVAKLPPD